eukprot:3872563-Pyramimonas_sp.AAC.1
MVVPDAAALAMAGDRTEARAMGGGRNGAAANEGATGLKVPPPPLPPSVPKGVDSDMEGVDSDTEGMNSGPKGGTYPALELFPLGTGAATGSSTLGGTSLARRRRRERAPIAGGR